MVLHPLAQIGLRVLVPVFVRRCERVMNLKHGGKRSKRDEDQGKRNGHAARPAWTLS
jgi:hypothetical protein